MSCGIRNYVAVALRAAVRQIGSAGGSASKKRRYIRDHGLRRQGNAVGNELASKGSATDDFLCRNSILAELGNTLGALALAEFLAVCIAE